MLRHLIFSSLLSFCLPCTACSTHFRRAANGTVVPQTYSVQTRIKPSVPTSNITITNVRVWDGNKVNDPSTVFVCGETIQEAAASVDQIVDGRNGILLPGLIDAHAHPGSVEDLEILSSYGVTTVLNQNCQDHAFCASMRDQTGLTSFFTAGLSAKGPGSSHANNSDAPLDQLIWEPTQAASYVADVFANGSDWLKIVSELHGPDQATQNALVLHAHALGKMVNTHAADMASYIRAILSKCDGPQHIPLDGLLNDTMLDLMHSQHQFATPTLNVFYDELHIPGAGAALDHSSITFDSAWPLLKKNVAAIHARDIPILAGTDSTTPYAGLSIPFGISMHDELWHLSEAGLPTSDILRAATVLPALAYNFPDRGSISPGMRADMVLLQPDADPITAINDTRKIARVWNGGLEYTDVAL